MTAKKLFVSLALAASLAAPVFTLADHTPSHTIEQLQAQIAALQAQINVLSPQALSSTLQNNDSVRAATVLKIRTAAGLSGTAIAKAPAGSTGVIRCNLVSGGACPATANGLRWWYVDWDNSSLPNGWSAEGSSEALFLVQLPTIVPSPSTPRPSITVLSPNGGEVWKAGTTQVVRWSNNNFPSDRRIDLIRLRDSYGKEIELSSNITNIGYDKVAVPTLVPAGSYTLEIKTYSTNGDLLFDASDRSFSIVSAPNNLQLTVPNNGEKWQIGSVHTIQWTPYDPQSGVNVVPTVSAYLERQVNGSFVTVGKVQEDGKASIHWSGMIGNTPQQSKLADPGEYYIRVVNSRTGEWDRGDAPFTLVAQNTVKADLKINGLDTTWDAPFALPAGGGEVTLSWTSTNADSCKLYFNGLADDLYGLPISGQKSVFLKQNPHPNMTNVSVSCGSPIGDARDAVYIASVNANSQVTVISPNGGESLSSEYPITWTSSMDIFKVSIALYKNDAFYRWIATDYSVQSTNGSLTWILTKTISDDDKGAGAIYKIYMIGYKSSGGTVEDKSDAPFSIVTPPPSTPPIQVSTGGLISQKLHYVPSSNSFYGIGSDNAVWKWDNAAKQWSRITDGSIKDDFHFISESDIYAIGMDNQIWHWNGIRWSQESQGGKIQQKIWYVDGNHIYGIGMDNQVWRWGSAGGWVQITSNGKIKDDFHFISESDIYGIGMDNQIWRWNGTSWNQHSSGGVIKQKLHFFSSNNIWGIGTDNKIWKWSAGGNWQHVYETGQIKDDFVPEGNGIVIYGISLDNQIWKWTAPVAAGRQKNDVLLANALFAIEDVLKNIAGVLRSFTK